MIQPIFFPFTHIKKSDISLMSSFFKSILFFPASTSTEFEKDKHYTGNADFLLPLYAEEQIFDRVLQKVNEYRNWGELNKDNRGNLKEFLKDQPYLTDPSGIASIRSGITRRGDVQETESGSEESLIKDLMFLRLAKIHDQDKEVLEDNLFDIEKGEQRLFSEIRGLNMEYDGKSEDNKPGNKEIDDFGAHMTAARIGAWIDCFNSHKPFSSLDSHPLFITTSYAVMENLMSIAKNKIKLLDIDNLKVHENTCGNKNQWVEIFHKFVDTLVKSGEQASDMPAEIDDNCTLVAKIKLYLLQGDDISSFFQGVGKKIPVCFISV